MNAPFVRVGSLLAFGGVVLASATPEAFAATTPSITTSFIASWRTPSERSGYKTTPNYQETLAYCDRLAAASPWVRLTYYGTSGQGRRLPLIIVSKDRAFTPEAARATGKPVILIQNGIHSGEIEGKDASLELVRDMCVIKKHEKLLDQAILLILPIFSVDSHERSSKWNRINQNGPTEMGWRPTPIGLNLNRDYVKLETPEMRALIGNVFTEWWPHLLIDNHTTNGADYRHDLTYGIAYGSTVPEAVERWNFQAFEDRVVPRTIAMGHLTAPYLTFVNGNDPRSGIEGSATTPRFSNAYPTLHGRPGILVETHMLKPYGPRVRATYDLMVAVLEEINAHPNALIDAVREAESDAVARGKRALEESMRLRTSMQRSATALDPRPRVVLRGKVSGRTAPFAFKGKRTRWERSEITGGIIPRYSEAAWDTMIPWQRELTDSVTTTVPAGYLVPREWTHVRELLDLHGLRYRRLAKRWTGAVERQKVVKWRSEKSLREGHLPTVVDSVSLEPAKRTFEPEDLWIPTAQPSGLLVMHLLEARAPDGIMFWNGFDTVLMQKEYAEQYVIDPIAKRMMREKPALADSFRARLARDSAFARDSSARAQWFYERSPWADPDLNFHPAVRALEAPPEAALVSESPKAR